jgi:hypothetical protein
MNVASVGMWTIPFADTLNWSRFTHARNIVAFSRNQGDMVYRDATRRIRKGSFAQLSHIRLTPLQLCRSEDHENGDDQKGKSDRIGIHNTPR